MNNSWVRNEDYSMKLLKKSYSNEASDNKKTSTGNVQLSTKNCPLKIKGGGFTGYTICFSVYRNL